MRYTDTLHLDPTSAIGAELAAKRQARQDAQIARELRAWQRIVDDTGESQKVCGIWVHPNPAKSTS